jgi:hypothetical protein
MTTEAITPLRQGMIEDMNSRKLCAHTQRGHIYSCKRFTAFLNTFLVDGIEMSNFVHPSWFEPFKHPPGTKFDHLGLLTKPFSMTKGGYVILKKKEGDRSFRFQGKGKAFRARGSSWSPQRVPQI